MESGRARYASLGVGQAAGIVRAAAWGPDGPLTEAARFSIASITKPITATAVMQLVEEGAVVLAAPVATYVPEFRPGPASEGEPGGEAVRVRHVLTHTSGVAETPEDYLERVQPTAAETLTWVCEQPLRHTPDTEYRYTSDSFYLLAEIVRRCRGMSFADALRTRLFEPLGMSATTFDPFADGPASLPLGGYFERYGEAVEYATRYFASLEAPGGGLWSTAEDLVRFGRAMLLGGTLDGARVLGEPFVRLMTREHTADVREMGAPPRSPGYGLGWSLPGLGHVSPASASAFGHGGASGSALLVDPDHDLVVVYLRNEWGAEAWPTDEAIQAVYAALV